MSAGLDDDDEGFEGCSGGCFRVFWNLRGGGYLGIGIGGKGEALVTVGSVGGGFEGNEEKRLPPGSDATIITMEVDF